VRAKPCSTAPRGGGSGGSPAATTRPANWRALLEPYEKTSTGGASIAAGGWVHPALVVGSVEGSERGLFATSAVPRGPLAYVPRCACVTSADAEAGFAARLWWDGDDDFAPAPVAAALAAPEARLAAHLLLRAFAPADKDAADAYVQSLPGCCERHPGGRALTEALAPFPLTWHAEQVAALRHPALEAALLAARGAAESQHAALAGPVCDETGFTPSLQDWLWARALVASRAERSAGGAHLALEPLLDCVNHGPSRRRNAQRVTVPPRISSAAADAAPAGLAHLPAECDWHGAAALVALRPLRAGEEVVLSYQDGAPGGGDLTAQECLSRYGFLPAAHADAPHVVSDADAAAARAALAATVAGAAAAGKPLRDALAAHARDVAAGAAADHVASLARDDAAARARALAWCDYRELDAATPARLAARYRRGRRLALGRAALARLPPCTEALAAGVAAGVAAAQEEGVFAAWPPAVAAAYGAMVLQALVGEEAALLRTPEQGLQLLR
jgi:hypothetical protein